MDRQLALPIAALENRDAAYRAELDRAALPEAGRRVAAWILDRGAPQRSADGERLYVLPGGSLRDLADRSGIPRSTLHRGLDALGATSPVVLCNVRGALCLVAGRLAELPDAPAAVPVATKDDWGRVSIPKSRPVASQSVPPLSQRVPECPTAVPPLSQRVPVCPTPVPPLSHAENTSISARAPLVVVVSEFLTTTNYQPNAADVKDLARRAWQRLHGTNKPRRPNPFERRRMFGLAALALSTDLGEPWLMAAAAERPAPGAGPVRSPLAWLVAVAANHAWALAVGEPAEDAETRATAGTLLKRALSAVVLPESLLQPRQHGELCP